MCWRGPRPDWRPADGGTGTFTLNSNQAVSGAGSGIVAGPDRVRGVVERPQGGGGRAAGPAAALGVTGCYPHRVGVGGVHEKQRGGGASIGRFSWAADARYADV